MKKSLAYRCSGNLDTCDNTCYEDENDLCPGDDGEPPCCVGGEKEDGTEWEPHPECFGGPGTISPQFPAFQGNESVVHAQYVTALPEGGLRQTISLDHLTSFNGAKDKTTAPHANYLRKLDVLPEDLEKLNRNDLPVFLQRSVYEYPPRLFFKFSCLDGADEVIHQILLMIREWNTWEELKTFIESAGGNERSDPDVEGREGPDCAYEERPTVGEQSLCNDESDLDDYSDYPKVEYGRWEGDE